MHKDINEIITLFSVAGIKMGLVTNGLLLGRLRTDVLNKITWCRVSCCDERPFDQRAVDILHSAVERAPNVDWAFSYVVGESYAPANLASYLRFANEHTFTHVRVVSDLCDLDHVASMDFIKSGVAGTDDRLAIYQGRKHYDPGSRQCWISQLKPMIGADGKVYPCCGVQYAHIEQDFDMPETMCTGSAFKLKEALSKPFDGAQCYRCYYKNYNDILEQMITDIEHLEFV